MTAPTCMVCNARDPDRVRWSPAEASGSDGRQQYTIELCAACQRSRLSPEYAEWTDRVIRLRLHIPQSAKFEDWMASE